MRKLQGMAMEVLEREGEEVSNENGEEELEWVKNP